MNSEKRAELFEDLLNAKRKSILILSICGALDTNNEVFYDYDFCDPIQIYEVVKETKSDKEALLEKEKILNETCTLLLKLSPSTGVKKLEELLRYIENKYKICCSITTDVSYFYMYIRLNKEIVNS